MHHPPNRRESFNTVADLYCDARPGYPEALIDEIIRFAELGPGDRILEVGCGPGQATVPFARRGYAMLCIEIGAQLAEVARRRCRDFPHVDVITTAFEQWSPDGSDPFALLVAGSSFHWVDPAVGYSLASRALRPGGTLALFWNSQSPGDTPTDLAVQQAYSDVAPDMGRGRAFTGEEGRRQFLARHDERLRDIEQSGRFGPVTLREFPWMRTFSPDEYVRLLGTYSDHITLDESLRTRLFDAVRDAIVHTGGAFARHYVSTLYLTRSLRP